MTHPKRGMSVLRMQLAYVRAQAALYSLSDDCIASEWTAASVAEQAAWDRYMNSVSR